MDGLAVLNWGRNNDSAKARALDVRECTHLLPAFMKERGLFFLHPRGQTARDPDVPDYAEMLKGCTIIEMFGGTDFAVASDRCIEYLETGMISG
jgi:HprK-related kinase B